jgi:hypothetical protein
MWWIPAGTLPTIADAVCRLNSIGDRGDTDFAFTFRKIFAAPAAQGARAQQP